VESLAVSGRFPVFHKPVGVWQRIIADPVDVIRFGDPGPFRLRKGEDP